MKLLLSDTQLVCSFKDFLVCFSGSTMSSCLLFVFPGVFYLKISNQPLRSVDSVGVNPQFNIYHMIQDISVLTYFYFCLQALILVVFGVIMGAISLTVIVVTWIMNS